MKLIAFSWHAVTLALAAAICCSSFQLAAAAAAATGGGQALAPPAVGLYAPDRYDGIPEMCLMPMDFGYCRAKVKRYYFDMRRMKCAMFYWGGCAGNINNFKSLDDCNKNCLDDNYVEEVNSNRNSISNNNNKAANNDNGKGSNINPSKLFKPSSNFKAEQRRLDLVAKTSERHEQIDDQAEDEDYEQ